MARPADEALSASVKRLRENGPIPHDAAAVIAHEMRNPLNAMMGFTQMLKDEWHGAHSDPRYREYSEMVHASAEKLLRICNRLLDGGDFVSSKPGEKSVTAAKKVIARTLHLYSAMAQSREIDLVMSVDDAFPDLKISEEVFEGILGNLISNAIKFTPPGGRVTVQASVSIEDGAVVLVIADTGVGMPPAMVLDLIRDFPVPSGIGPHGDTGSGIGLSLVRKWLASLGVGLRFSSEENSGTSVILTFPSQITELAAGN
jgi:signal transduction histidine kinase